MTAPVPFSLPDPKNITPEQFEGYLDFIAVRQEELLAGIKSALRTATCDKDCAQLVGDAVAYNALAAQLGLLAQQLAVHRFYERQT